MSVVLALVGCGDELTPCEQAARVEDPALIVGLGEDDFEAALHDGQHVEPAYGTQGGRHLWLAVKTRGFQPGERHGLFAKDEDIPTFHADLVGADDGVTYTTGDWQYQAMNGDPGRATLALGQFVVTSLPQQALDQLLVLGLTGTDVCGDELAGDATIGLTGIESYGGTF